MSEIATDELPLGPSSKVHAVAQSTTIRAFIAAWEILLSHKLGDLPSRRELQPRIIKSFMSSCWLYSRNSEGTFSCILAGDAVRDFWRAPTRGRNLQEIIPNGDHIEVQNRRSLARDGQCLIHSINRSAGKHYAVVERIYAPLMRDLDGIAYVFGCSDYNMGRKRPSRTVAPENETMNLFDASSLALVDEE
ncbi:MAG: PAS domain-containing protein [Azospirillaceae bacterium]